MSSETVQAVSKAESAIGYSNDVDYALRLIAKAIEELARAVEKLERK